MDLQLLLLQKITSLKHSFLSICTPYKSTEIDPNGKSPNEAGAKLDAGKVCPSLIIEGMARALWGVAEVATFGMMKYTRDGWVSVSDGQFRYATAQYRHVLKRAMGETIDPDSELWHLKHEAWNALAKLDLAMREEETKRNERKREDEHELPNRVSGKSEIRSACV